MKFVCIIVYMFLYCLLSIKVCYIFSSIRQGMYLAERDHVSVVNNVLVDVPSQSVHWSFSISGQ